MIPYPNMIQSLGIAGIIVLMMLLVGGISDVILSLFLGKSLAFFFSYILSTGLAVWIVCRIRKKKTEKTVSFCLSLFNGRIVLWTALGTLGLAWGIASLLESMIPMPDYVKEIFAEMTGRADFFIFLALVVAAPILEEVLFRGIMLDGLLKQYSPVKSIVFSSILFGAVHLNPWQFIVAFTVGIFAGWIFYKTQSLGLCILVHATTNLFSILGGVLIGDFDTKFLTSLGLVIYLLSILAGIVLFIKSFFILKREFVKIVKNEETQAEIQAE